MYWLVVSFVFPSPSFRTLPVATYCGIVPSVRRSGKTSVKSRSKSLPDVQEKGMPLLK